MFRVFFAASYLMVKIQELKAETENKDDIDIQVDQLAAPKLNNPGNEKFYKQGIS